MRTDGRVATPAASLDLIDVLDARRNFASACARALPGLLPACESIRRNVELACARRLLISTMPLPFTQLEGSLIWSRWVGWCTRNDMTPLPISGIAIVYFLIDDIEAANRMTHVLVLEMYRYYSFPMLSMLPSLLLSDRCSMEAWLALTSSAQVSLPEWRSIRACCGISTQYLPFAPGPTPAATPMGSRVTTENRLITTAAQPNGHHLPIYAPKPPLPSYFMQQAGYQHPIDFSNGSHRIPPLSRFIEVEVESARARLALPRPLLPGQPAGSDEAPIPASTHTPARSIASDSRSSLPSTLPSKVARIGASAAPVGPFSHAPASSIASGSRSSLPWTLPSKVARLGASAAPVGPFSHAPASSIASGSRSSLPSTQLSTHVPISSIKNGGPRQLLPLASHQTRPGVGFTSSTNRSLLEKDQNFHKIAQTLEQLLLALRQKKERPVGTPPAPAPACPASTSELTRETQQDVVHTHQLDNLYAISLTRILQAGGHSGRVCTPEETRARVPVQNQAWRAAFAAGRQSHTVSSGAMADQGAAALRGTNERPPVTEPATGVQAQAAAVAQLPLVLDTPEQAPPRLAFSAVPPRFAPSPAVPADSGAGDDAALRMWASEKAAKQQQAVDTAAREQAALDKHDAVKVLSFRPVSPHSASPSIIPPVVPAPSMAPPVAAKEPLIQTREAVRPRTPIHPPKRQLSDQPPTRVRSDRIAWPKTANPSGEYTRAQVLLGGHTPPTPPLGSGWAAALYKSPSQEGRLVEEEGSPGNALAESETTSSESEPVTDEGVALQPLSKRARTEWVFELTPTISLVIPVLRDGRS